jgi:hypothetical protein
MYTAVLINLLLVVSLTFSCNTVTPKDSTGQSESVANYTASPNSKYNSGARQVDFSNFSYDWYPRWEGMLTNHNNFTLTNGKLEVDSPRGSNEPVLFELVNVQYADLTGDKVEDAIVTIKMSVMGSANPYVVFVYKSTTSGVRRIWAHETGDRADEGLRNVYVSDLGFLTIEQYRASRVGPNGGTAIGMCCPPTFTRTYYKWNTERFEVFHEEAIPNEYPDARVLLIKSSGTTK